MKLLVVVVCSVLVAAVSCEVQYQHPEEWQLWKTQHGKSYGSQREELERHLVWLANREYINAHNKNAHILGFTLAMNHLGDIVSLHPLNTSTLGHSFKHILDSIVDLFVLLPLLIPT